MSFIEQTDKQRQMQRAYQSYSGNPPQPLIRVPGQPDDNLIISLGRLIVDKGASFLFGQAVETQITVSQPEPKQDWLDECWRRNKRAVTLLKLATNGGIFGHAFVRILATAPYPRVVVLDPQTVEVMTDPDDIDAVWKFTITPPPDEPVGDEPPVQRRTIIATANGLAGYRVTEAPDTWTIVDQVFQGGVWVQTAATEWLWPFSPIQHCQNLPKPNDFWGESDLPSDVLKLLDGINRVSSNFNKIIRVHAGPKVYARGMGTRTIDTAIDSIISLPSEKAELKVLEIQSDLASTLALLSELKDDLATITRVPRVAWGKADNLGPISGVALKVRYQPIVEKTEAKRMTYGDLLVEVNRCLLAMAGFGDAIITNLVWPNIVPQDDLAERQVAVLDDSLGIASKETLATRFDYDYEEEQQRIVTERKAAIAAGLVPDPTVPPPAAIQAPKPDIAKTSRSQ